MSIVTPDLLKRYAQNNCTAAQKATVEQWLAGNEPVLPAPLAETNNGGAKEEMWQSIYAATIAKDYQHKKLAKVIRLVAYPFAACLLMAFGILLQHHTNNFSSYTSIDNVAGIGVKKATIGNLTFIVEPGSRCDIATPLWGTESNVKFCGAVSVENLSVQNSNLHINTGLSTCKMAYADEVTLRKGQTYLAMTDDYYNVITATTDELEDGLPKPFSTRLQKRFNL